MNMLVIRLLLGGLAIVAFGYVFMHSHKFFMSLAKSQTKFAKLYYNLFGTHVKQLHVNFTRKVNLNKQSRLYKIYMYYNDIIVNLDMAKDNVTVVGLLIFIIACSLAGTLLLATAMGALLLAIPIFAIFFYLFSILFRFFALMKYEKREAEIMDSVDLLISDIDSGVQNAIIRYRDSFQPTVKPYFLTFIDDVQNKGYSFNEAMGRLNDAMGLLFSDFAQKAIIYEAEADSDMADIFSVIMERNRQRRILRDINNRHFAEARLQFIISLFLILGYSLFTAVTEPAILVFLFKTTFGRLMLLFDIGLIGFVMSYLAVIKAKSL